METVERLGFLQLDPIATVAPAQHVVLWSRFGSRYDSSELDRLLWKERKLVEWNAYLYPAHDLPLLKALMRRRDRPHDRHLIEYLKQNASFRRYVLRELEQRGPLLSREIEDHKPSRRDAHRWWGERKMGLMLGVLNARGEVAVVGRNGKQRIWDLAERWYPETERVLARRREAAPGGAEAAPAGRLARAGPLARPSRRRRPSRPRPRSTLLDAVRPADPRPERARRRCGTSRYRIEIYVPAAKREYGYYVLPLLVGDRIVGRAEPVFDRRTRTLRLLGAWGDTSRLDEALDDLAAWLGAVRA